VISCVGWPFVQGAPKTRYATASLEEEERNRRIQDERGAFTARYNAANVARLIKDASFGKNHKRAFLLTHLDKLEEKERVYRLKNCDQAIHNARREALLIAGTSKYVPSEGKSNRTKEIKIQKLDRLEDSERQRRMSTSTQNRSKRNAKKIATLFKEGSQQQFAPLKNRLSADYAEDISDIISNDVAFLEEEERKSRLNDKYLQQQAIANATKEAGMIKKAFRLQISAVSKTSQAPASAQVAPLAPLDLAKTSKQISREQSAPIPTQSRALPLSRGLSDSTLATANLQQNAPFQPVPFGAPLQNLPPFQSAAPYATLPLTTPVVAASFQPLNQPIVPALATQQQSFPATQSLPPFQGNQQSGQFGGLPLQQPQQQRLQQPQLNAFPQNGGNFQQAGGFPQVAPIGSTQFRGQGLQQQQQPQFNSFSQNTPFSGTQSGAFPVQRTVSYSQASFPLRKGQQPSTISQPDAKLIELARLMAQRETAQANEEQEKAILLGTPNSMFGKLKLRKHQQAANKHRQNAFQHEQWIRSVTPASFGPVM